MSRPSALALVALLLTAYGIPVGFHTVTRVIGGNSVANLAAVTPGSFVHPAATVEDMYRPDRYGRSQSGNVEVTAAK